MGHYRYTIVIYPDDGRYSVAVPALPGCFTWGDTYQDALAMAHDAVRGHLETLMAEGEPVPSDVTPQTVTIEVEVAEQPPVRP